MASQETRFAVFGDSYVRRQGAFTKERLPYNVRFFGKGGMELLRIPTEEWNRLLNYKPDVVLLHLGGNDIRDLPVNPKRPRGENFYVGAYNQARVLFDAMNRRIKELTRLGIKVMVGQVLDRGVEKETFDLVRKGLNRRLRDLLRHNFIFFTWAESINVDKMFKSVMGKVNTLRERGIHVVIGEILPRAEYALKKRKIPLDLFEKVRKGLNKKGFVEMVSF